MDHAYIGTSTLLTRCDQLYVDTDSVLDMAIQLAVTIMVIFDLMAFWCFLVACMIFPFEFAAFAGIPVSVVFAF